MRSALGALGLLLLLSACASRAPRETTAADPAQAAAQQEQALQRLAGFRLSGRLSSGFGLRGDLRWTQAADGSFQLRVAGPFGARPVDLRSEGEQVVVTSAEGEVRTPDPEGYVQQRLGWRFPLGGLRHWVLGRPLPAIDISRLARDEQGRLRQLQQAGWTVDYLEYDRVGEWWLPVLLDARSLDARGEPVSLRLRIDQWTPEAAP